VASVRAVQNVAGSRKAHRHERDLLGREPICASDGFNQALPVDERLVSHRSSLTAASVSIIEEVSYTRLPRHGMLVTGGLSADDV